MSGPVIQTYPRIRAVRDRRRMPGYSLSPTSIRTDSVKLSAIAISFVLLQLWRLGLDKIFCGSGICDPVSGVRAESGSPRCPNFPSAKNSTQPYQACVDFWSLMAYPSWCVSPLQNLLQIVGENDTRIVTNRTPKRISSSGHHRSNPAISLDELI